MKCPLCDSKLSIKNVEKSSMLPSGDKFSFNEKLYHCENCGFEQGKDSKNKSYDASRKSAVQSVVKRLVESLQDKFKNLLFIERTLDLPRRTMSRWKHSGDGSTSSLLLLKLIDTYPFLVDVAENKFDPKFAQTALQNAAKKVDVYSQSTRHVYWISTSTSNSLGNSSNFVMADASSAGGRVVAISQAEHRYVPNAYPSGTKQPLQQQG